MEKPVAELSHYHLVGVMHEGVHIVLGREGTSAIFLQL